MSYITGFVIRSQGNGGCYLGYVAHCDPQGKLPPWLVNKVTHTVGPRMVKDLRKASEGYVVWKNGQPHNRKPWRFPEEITCPRIFFDDVSVCCYTFFTESGDNFYFDLSASNQYRKTTIVTQQKILLYPQNKGKFLVIVENFDHTCINNVMFIGHTSI